MSSPRRSADDVADRAYPALLAICRRDAPTDAAASWLAALDDNAVRESLIELAGKHHVTGLVLSAAARRFSDPSERTPPIDRWLADYSEARRRVALLEMKRDRVVHALRSNGIEPVILKGAAMWGTVYADPVERTVADLDILVEDVELDEAIEHLKALDYHYPFSPAIFDAYRRDHFHIPVHQRQGHIVEIHWALARPTWPFQLDAHAVRRESASAGAIRVPRPEHLLLHTVLQNVQERFSRLDRLVDVDRLVALPGGLDWKSVVTTSHSGGLGGPAALTLHLAAQLLGTPVPGGVVDDLLPGSLARFHLALLQPREGLLRQRLRGTFAAAELLDLWLMSSPGQRSTRLRELLHNDELAVLFDGEGPGLPARLLRWPKLALRQAQLYLSAALGLSTSAGRRRLRFWSSPAGNRRAA